MRFLWPLLLLIAGIGGNAVWASDTTVRLAFLLNFSRFAELPERGSIAAGGSMVFCLAPGDREMALEFSSLEKQAVQGRPVKTLQISRIGEVAHCQVLFLPVDFPGTVGSWLQAAEQVGALTVSDRTDFIDEGGMIGLFPAAGRYRFDVNLGAAKRADLRLNPGLLKLARTVK